MRRPRARSAAARPALLAPLAVAIAAGALSLRWVWTASGAGAGYAAKVGCSLVLLSGQDAEALLQEYIALEVAPLGPVLDLEVRDDEAVASVLGMPRARAVFRDGLGCTLAHGRPLPPVGELPPRTPRSEPAAPWPRGEAPPRSPAPAGVAAAIDRAFEEPRAGDRRRQTKAVVVAHAGRLVAERYAVGYGPDTPMLSWSMAKSVTATLVGLAAEEGRLDPFAPAPVPEWSGPSDPRRAITLDQLLRMSSGLRFDERAGPTSDLSVMLFLRPDTGGHAVRMPLAAPPDTRWSYSSGTSNAISRILRDAFGGDLAAMVRWSRERLFDAAGMHSALLEPDASGSFVGSSFAFMTARDWARFGELHRRDGLWRGGRVLPEGWVRYVTTPTPAAPAGGYGAHWWLNAGPPGDPDGRPWPELPRDTYAARGHSGQYLVVVPSAQLVVVRLGLSYPDDGDDGAHQLVAELVRHYRPVGG